MTLFNSLTDGVTCEAKPRLATPKQLSNLSPRHDAHFTHALTTPQLQCVNINAEREGTTRKWPAVSHQPSVLPVFIKHFRVQCPTGYFHEISTHAGRRSAR